VTVVSRAGSQRNRPADSRSCWLTAPRPFRSRRVRTVLSDLMFTVGFGVHMSRTHRFNRIWGFRGFENQLAASRASRRVALRQGHPVARWLGWPFPRSRLLLRLLNAINFAPVFSHSEVNEILDVTGPDLLVVGHVQTPFVTPVILGAKKRRIPILGVLGSWDHPTTKGPIPDGLSHLAIPNRDTADELMRFGVPENHWTIVGWPQMDVYRTQPRSDRATALRRLRLEEDRTLILAGTYPSRLGAHEPAVLAELATAVGNGEFGARVSLVIRSHPMDSDWTRRFGMLHAPPAVVVQAPQLGSLGELADLIAHSAVVITSAGTLCLDAAALDTPAVGLAFSLDPHLPAQDNPMRLFEMDHYAKVVATGGVRVATSFGELTHLIQAYLSDPSRDRENRHVLRSQFLEPLDGDSAHRIARLAGKLALHGRHQP
jgi:hypothetical protein